MVAVVAVADTFPLLQSRSASESLAVLMQHLGMPFEEEGVILDLDGIG